MICMSRFLSLCGPTGPQLKDYYHNGGFVEMLLNLRANQIAGGRISEAEVQDINEGLY
jgi:hypothetical protein